MTDNEFRRVTLFIEKRIGLQMEEKRNVVEGRIANLIRVSEYKDLNSILNIAELEVDGREAHLLVDLLTTNHTYFLREKEHLVFLKEELLPNMYERYKKERFLRVWCGAAATGEEPYSIAMTLNDFFLNEGVKWDAKVLATDVSRKVLSIARKGEYPQHKIQVLSPDWRKRYFIQQDNQKGRIIDGIQEQVIFQELNLIQPFSFAYPIQIIFLKNVMIYFDSITRLNLINRVYDILEPGGYLFIGLTETIDRGKTGFEYIRPSIYYKPMT